MAKCVGQFASEHVLDLLIAWLFPKEPLPSTWRILGNAWQKRGDLVLPRFLVMVERKQGDSWKSVSAHK